MTIRALFAGAALMLASSCNQGPELPIKEFMAQRVQTTAMVYWDAVRYESELVDGKPVERDIRPQTDAEWAKVRQAAVDLQAFGALLQTEDYAAGRGEGWNQFASAMVEVSKRAEQAAVDKNPDKVFEVGGTVYAVCSACHQAYPPAAAGAPQ